MNKPENKIKCSIEKFKTKHVPDIPLFGIDIGGTLVKLVYFEPLDLSINDEGIENEVLKKILHYLIGNTAYGETGIRDVYLEMKSIQIGDRKGNLHFIRFPTNRMENFINFCIKNKLHTLTFEVYATGGGAYKFESEITEKLKINWIKCDELDMLIKGVQFANEINLFKECYYFRIIENQLQNKLSENPIPSLSSNSSNACYVTDSLKKTDFIKENFEFTNTYPYILVNIGSGVSILLIESEKKYKRVSGSSIGGGTFLGLCCLLTGCSTYEEAIDLATRGDSTKVDKLVSDIYGGDYSKFKLSGDVVASSFGLMCIKEKRELATKEDLAKSTLLTVLNNIGLLARESAFSNNCQIVLFVGNFLRVNNISKQILSYALNYWSNGTMRALFLQHEGYFGAIGCLTKFIEASV